MSLVEYGVQVNQDDEVDVEEGHGPQQVILSLPLVVQEVSELAVHSLVIHLLNAFEELNAFLRVPFKVDRHSRHKDVYWSESFLNRVMFLELDVFVQHFF